MLTLEEGSTSDKVLCTAEAYPEAAYVWTKDGETVASDNLLFFDGGVTREQAGEYACVAENRHGKAEAVTKVDVLCKDIWIYNLLVFGSSYNDVIKR